MQTIELLAGTHIENAAQQLVQNAPARAVFNGIELVAHQDEAAALIEWRYVAASNARAEAYAASPEGKRSAAEAVERLANAQATVDAQVLALVSVDYANTDAVLAWVEGIANASDYIGIRLNRAALREMFGFSGWGIGVNCGADFKADDERNFAGWIVGQWLDCWHPMVSGFIADWRAKFRGAK